MYLPQMWDKRTASSWRSLFSSELPKLRHKDGQKVEKK